MYSKKLCFSVTLVKDIVKVDGAYQKRVYKLKNKHLTLQDRFEIECMLLNGQSFAKIGEALRKNKTTISREVKNHYIVKKQ